MSHTLSQFASALIQASSIQPYNSEFANNVRTNRTQLTHLFFDVLLQELTGIDSTSFYPPKDNASVLLLLQKIDQSATKELNGVCLNFYLLLDFGAGEDGMACYYAREIDMPIGYSEMITGLWLLDHQQWQEALVKLCHPQVSSHFAGKIIHAYMKLSPDDAGRGAQQTVAYIQANCPALKTEQTLELYVQMLCGTNLYSALEFARAASPDVSLSVFDAMVKFCFQNKPKKNIWRLVNLPLSNDESQMLQEEILQPIIASNSPDSALARDVLLMRCLHTGQVQTARQVTQNSNSHAMGNNSGAASENFAVGYSDLCRGLALS